MRDERGPLVPGGALDPAGLQVRGTASGSENSGDDGPGRSSSRRRSRSSAAAADHTAVRPGGCVRRPRARSSGPRTDPTGQRDPAELAYGDSATIRVTNVGRRRRKDPADRGFWLDRLEGRWLNDKAAKDTTVDADALPDAADVKAKVLPYVEDRRNILTVRFAHPLDTGTAPALRYTLERAREPGRVRRFGPGARLRHLAGCTQPAPARPGAGQRRGRVRLPGPRLRLADRPGRCLRRRPRARRPATDRTGHRSRRAARRHRVGVIRIRHDDGWAAVVGKHPSVFGTLGPTARV